MNTDGPLGRGLNSLIPENDNDLYSDSLGFKEIPVQAIMPSPYQPRKEFSEVHLHTLAESIKQQGILQPLVVVKHPKKADQYQLIAGERRLRACKMLELATVPAIIRDEISEQDQAALALIENIQRQNLNPIERAKGYTALIERFDLTQQEVADQMCVSRPVVANTLRLLELPDEVQQAMLEGKITEGHARVIAGLSTKKDQLKVLNSILRNSLNVRDTEQMVKNPNYRLSPVSKDTKKIVTQVSKHLKNEVNVRRQKDHYVVTMRFDSEEEIQKMGDYFKK